MTTHTNVQMLVIMDIVLQGNNNTNNQFLKYIPHHNQSRSLRDSGKASNKESVGNGGSVT